MQCFTPSQSRNCNSAVSVLLLQHVSGDAPIRRLSFGAPGSEGCVSPEPAGDFDMDGMDEDAGMDQQQQAWQQQQWAQQQHQGAHQHTPSAAAQPAQLHISPQPPNQDLLLSPSPPPVQQLFSQQHQQLPAEQQQQQRSASVQQQLFAPVPAPNSGCHLRPQQLWPGQQQQQQVQPQQLFGQPQQQRQMWGNPMSPAGAPRPPAMQGSTTPARLFR